LPRRIFAGVRLGEREYTDALHVRPRLTIDGGATWIGSPSKEIGAIDPWSPPRDALPVSTTAVLGKHRRLGHRPLPAEDVDWDNAFRRGDVASFHVVTSPNVPAGTGAASMAHEWRLGLRALDPD
jgi:hypothetical protein